MLDATADITGKTKKRVGTCAEMRQHKLTHDRQEKIKLRINKLHECLRRQNRSRYYTSWRLDGNWLVCHCAVVTNNQLSLHFHDSWRTHIDGGDCWDRLLSGIKFQWHLLLGCFHHLHTSNALQYSVLWMLLPWRENMGAEKVASLNAMLLLHPRSREAVKHNKKLAKAMDYTTVLQQLFRKNGTHILVRTHDHDHERLWHVGLVTLNSECAALRVRLQRVT